MERRLRSLPSFASGLLILCLAAPSDAQTPHLLGYQGRLLRSDGTSATGTASVAFSILDAASGGSALWTETQTLGLSDGYYSTFLGLVSPVPDGTFDAGARWLELRVGSETLAPRQQIGTVARAMTAASVAGGSASVSLLRVGGQTVVDADGRLAGNARYSAGQGVSIDSAQTVSLQACAAGQSLVHDASAWQCATAGVVTSVSASAPLTAGGTTAAPQLSLPRAAANASGYLASSDWSLFASKYDENTQCGGDLSGYLPAPVVARLQSRPVSAGAPSAGQVLKWSGAQWEPAADLDSGGTVRSLTGHAPLTIWNGSVVPEISIAVAGAGSDGFLSSTDWADFDAKYDASTACAGDLSGTYASPLVARIRGADVATTVPSEAQVLRFDGTAWTPASLRIDDVGGLSSGYLDLTGDQSIGGAKHFASAPSFAAPLTTASGGTGLASAPTAAGQYLRSAGAGAWSVGSIQSSDLPASLAQLEQTNVWGADLQTKNLRVEDSDGDTHLRVQSTGGLAMLKLAGAGGSGNLEFGRTANTLGWWSDTLGAQLLTVDNAGGNVGVGTAAPGYRLDVQGQANASGGLCIAGDCKSAWAQVGYWSLNNGSVYNNNGGGAGRVGIGTTNPAAYLDGRLAVVADGDNYVTIHGGLTNAVGIGFQRQTGTTLNGAVRYEHGDDSMDFFTTGAQRMTILGDGKVGVGTAAPQRLLHVALPATVGVNGDTLNSYGIAQFKVESSDGGKRGLEVGAPTGSISSPVYLKVHGTGNRFALLDQNNSENLTVVEGGRVGIGTSTPAYLLQVGGDFAGQGGVGIQWSANPSPDAGVLRFGDNTGWKFHIGRAREAGGGSALNTGSTGVLVTVQDDGKVGIGTSSPAYALTVRSAAVPAYVELDGTASAAQTGYRMTNDTGNSFGYFTYGSAFTTSGPHVSDGAHLFSSGAGGLSVESRSAGPIRFYVGAGMTERMRVDSSGNVGIGTTSPSCAGTGDRCLEIASDSPGLQLNGPGGKMTLTSASNGHYFDSVGGGTNDLIFRVDPSSTVAYTERMRITGAGNVVATGNVTASQFIGSAAGLRV